MDTAAFKKQLDESRRFEHKTEGGAAFRLQLPTAFAWRVAVDRHQDDRGRAVFSEVHRDLIETALVGWSGVTQQLISPEGGVDEVPFSRGAVALLLDHNPEILDALTVALAVKKAEREQQLEAARKNSPPASSTN